MPSPFKVLPQKAASTAKLTVSNPTRPGALTVGNLFGDGDGWHPQMGIEDALGAGHPEGVRVSRINLAQHYTAEPEIPSGLRFVVSEGGKPRYLRVEDANFALPEAIPFTPDEGALCMTEEFDVLSVQHDVTLEGVRYWRAGDYHFSLGGDALLYEQLPYGEAEILDGFNRESCFDHSFAVYSASKRNDVMYASNGAWKLRAGSGKVGHILRPFALCKDEGGVVLALIYGRWEPRGGNDYTKLIPLDEIPVGTSEVHVDATLGYSTMGVSYQNGYTGRIYGYSDDIADTYTVQTFHAGYTLDLNSMGINVGFGIYDWNSVKEAGIHNITILSNSGYVGMADAVRSEGNGYWHDFSYPTTNRPVIPGGPCYLFAARAKNNSVNIRSDNGTTAPMMGNFNSGTYDPDPMPSSVADVLGLNSSIISSSYLTAIEGAEIKTGASPHRLSTGCGLGV
ncbi:MAG: hypothetical protein C0609_01195 [Deltaproteobacteria bacterium]|nr:MAG: hypothetical protein C0609_01195 [Deltaproteobacteria bacterium]